MSNSSKYWSGRCSGRYRATFSEIVRSAIGPASVLPLGRRPTSDAHVRVFHAGSLRPGEGEAVLQIMLVVPFGVIPASMRSARLPTLQGRNDHGLRDIEHVAELQGADEFGVESPVAVVHRHVAKALGQPPHLLDRFLQRLLGSVHAGSSLHRPLQICANGGDALPAPALVEV